MTDGYNDDLTRDERPLLADGTLGGALPTDDSGWVRILNPITGSTLFTSNTDPQFSGLNPVTGVDAPVGTDVGFGAPIRRYFSSLVYNGSFQERPAYPDQPISDDNPIPYWRMVQASGNSFIFRWVEVGNGNGQIVAEMTSGAAGDLAYLEQLIPVNATVGATWMYEVIPYIIGTLNETDAYVAAQFLDGNLATTGTAATDSGDINAVEVMYPNTTGQAPGDAQWLRIRVGFQRNSGATTTETSTDNLLSEVTITSEAAVSSWRSWTPVLTFATPGDVSVSYTTQTGRYHKIGKVLWWWCTIVTSTFTHSTASGNLRVTGLPFVSATSSGFVWLGSAILRYTKANYTQVLAYVQSASALVVFPATGSGQTVATIMSTDMPTGVNVTLYASGYYEIA